MRDCSYSSTDRKNSVGLDLSLCIHGQPFEFCTDFNKNIYARAAGSHAAAGRHCAHFVGYCAPTTIGVLPIQVHKGCAVPCTPRAQPGEPTIHYSL